MGQRERERERDRESEKESQTDRHTHTETERETELFQVILLGHLACYTIRKHTLTYITTLGC